MAYANETDVEMEMDMEMELEGWGGHGRGYGGYVNRAPNRVGRPEDRLPDRYRHAPKPKHYAW